MAKSRGALVFFVLAYAITWGLQFPAVLAQRGVIAGPQERYLALVGLGAFGPMAAAMIASRLDGTGIRALFRPIRTWRVSPLWYLAALAIPGALFVVAASIYDAFGHAEPRFYLPDRPEFVAALICFSFGEEVGWRGYALPRLTARFGPLAASVIIGVLWTFWHIPMLTLQGIAPVLYLVFVPFMVGGSIFFTWIVRHTRGSLLLAMLAHAGAHLNNSGHALPAHATPMILHTIAWVILAIGLVAFDRRIWRRDADA